MTCIIANTEKDQPVVTPSKIYALCVPHLPCHWVVHVPPDLFHLGQPRKPVILQQGTRADKSHIRRLATMQSIHQLVLGLRSNIVRLCMQPGSSGHSGIFLGYSLFNNPRDLLSVSLDLLTPA